MTNNTISMIPVVHFYTGIIPDIFLWYIELDTTIYKSSSCSLVVITNKMTVISLYYNFIIIYNYYGF